MTSSVLLYDEYSNPLVRTVDVAKTPASLEPKQRDALTQVFEMEEARRTITALLPKGVTYEEVRAETAHVVAQNPELLECTTMSLIYAIGRAVATGLVIGEKVHIVPYSVKVSRRGEPERWVKRAQKITDYKGEIELVMQSGGAKQLNTLCVYENEVRGLHGGMFQYLDGSSVEVLHRRIYDPKDRGALFGAYACAWTAQGIPPKVVFMHLKEIEAIREKSKAWSTERVKDCPPWYAKKTVVHQIAKQLPMSTRVARLFRHIEVEEVEEVEEAVAA